MSPPNRRLLWIAALSAALGLLGWSCTLPPAPVPFVHVEVRGAHLDLSCEDCHGADIGPEPSECIGCHLEDRPDDHDPGRLEDCADCHAETDWGFAVDDHSFLPFEAAHDLLCLDCHEPDPDGGVVILSPARTCDGCHSDDRPSNHYPNEPGECADCHTWVRWPFHQFPKRHEGSSCGECHSTVTEADPDYSAFSCTDNCHRNVDGEHDGTVSTLPPQRCVDCHPNGDD